MKGVGIGKNQHHRSLNNRNRVISSEKQEVLQGKLRNNL